MSDVAIRMSRLFDPRSGRCFDVAVDHGFFGEASFLTGIEDLGAAVRVLADAGPDAIQLSQGQAHLLQEIPGRNRPALVLRTDVANVYGTSLPERLFSRLIPEPASRGPARRGLRRGQPVRPSRSARGPRGVRPNVLAARADCERYGMPLMVEPLVMKDADAGGYTSDGTTAKVVPLVRQAVELGRTSSRRTPPTTWPTTTSSCRRPAGSGAGARRWAGRRRRAAAADRRRAGAGGGGIVYGRNVIQHPDPAGARPRPDGDAARGRVRRGGAGTVGSGEQRPVRIGVVGGG